MQKSPSSKMGLKPVGSRAKYSKPTVTKHAPLKNITGYTYYYTYYYYYYYYY